MTSNTESLDYSNGIDLSYSNYNTISKNNITQNSLGCISLDYSDHNLITYNDLTNSVQGIDFQEASENTVYGNNIAHHSSTGVSMWGGRDNLIFYNNFVSCGAGGRDGRYIWDNGTIGNYWSNYNGTDTDNNGIGDEPYIFNVFSTMGYNDIVNIDNYPLMEPPVNIETLLDSSDQETPNTPTTQSPNSTSTTSLTPSLTQSPLPSPTQNTNAAPTEDKTLPSSPSAIGIQTENQAFLIIIISLSILIVALLLVFLKKRKGMPS